jgi:hypothetical protein
MHALSLTNQNDPRILSLIIDGMDQNHCHVPYKGTQASFSKPLKHGITGVKQHGYGLTLYRTVGTVQKGADLTIYCILSQIEGFRERHREYPEVVYLQLDGGSENANQYVLAMCELLVVKRIAREIYFTRLPTGHTHEDIDSCFAVIWSCFRSEPCETLALYKSRIEETFSATSLKAKMEDVYVIPDYKILLQNCIDTRLSNLHKEGQTQHQWRFEAVELSTYFPLGVKTMYRAYCSDRVVEFHAKPASKCDTRIGQAIGLEPVTVTCRWHPSSCTRSSRS